MFCCVYNSKCPHSLKISANGICAIGNFLQVCTAEHPTRGGPAAPWHTLFTVDLPHFRTAFSHWTCPIAEHPTHNRPSPHWKTLFTGRQKVHRERTSNSWADIATFRLSQPRGKSVKIISKLYMVLTTKKQNPTIAICF